MGAGESLAGNGKKVLDIRLPNVMSWSMAFQHRLRKGKVSRDPCTATTDK